MIQLELPLFETHSPVRHCSSCCGVVWWNRRDQQWNVSAWSGVHDLCPASEDGAHQPGGEPS